MSSAIAPSDPPRRRVTIVSGTAAYTDEGEGAPLVLVHGLPGSGRDFRWLAPQLSPTARVLRLDLPGFGETPSATATGCAVADQAGFVSSTLDALGVERAMVLGHSFGGMVAAEVAVRDPDRVAGLVLLSSPGLRPHRSFRRTPALPLSRLLHSRVHPLVRRLLQPGFRLAGFGPHFSDAQLERTLHMVAAVDFAEWVTTIRALRSPTAIAWCADDPLVEDAIAQELAEAAPGGPRLRFALGGHNPQKSHAEALAAWLIAFGAEVGLSARDAEPAAPPDPP